MDGSRRVAVPADRLPGWLTRYRANHPGAALTVAADRLTLTSPDGALAVLSVPYPPLELDGTDPEAALLAQLHRRRLIGIILARRGGYAIGVADGTQLIESKVGGGYVQGRTKAGGWSQQRFARRRSNQAQHVFGAAAEVAVRLLMPRVRELDAVVLGGHRDGTDGVLADPRLAPLRPLIRPGVIDTPDPRLRVLQDVVSRLSDVSIELNPLA